MKKPNFTLSRKNQKGQVAIFVALIFQVIFVFFALLINIGLLVHHKINLQQSTDLAAYYGAMKQAESLNAMAHVNFQLRQTWKLLAWRYRVLGTFGMQGTNDPSDVKPMFPVAIGTSGIAAIPNLAGFEGQKCPGGANTADTPFFCIGHAGMKGWEGGTAENVCKVNCLLLNNAYYTVQGVSNPSPTTQVGGAVAVHNALTQVNNTIQTICQELAVHNIKSLAQFILAYKEEMSVRSQTLHMIAANLSNAADEFYDLDGKLVAEGVKKTLKNNLTEANNDPGELTIKNYNSLSSPSCSIDKSKPASKHTSKTEFVKRIEFEFINFFIHSCRPKIIPSSIDANYNPGSIYDLNNTGLAKGEIAPSGIPTPNIKSKIDSIIESEIMALIANNDEKYTVGYEKNPWCPAYFVVQATAKPRIPFLPLVEIKLSAVSVAKPFGGTMGPWFRNRWESSVPNSQDGLLINDEAQQTDETLPMVNQLANNPTTLKDNSRLLMNFSRFVGDTKGLADPRYLSEYHAALISRTPDANSSFNSYSPETHNSPSSLSVPSEAPALNSWVATSGMTDADYDPLVGGSTQKDSFLRNLEIAAIAPNQFDLAYYSIDPDFYNNYYKRLSDPIIFGILKSKAGGVGPANEKFIRPDFGNNKNIYTQKPEFAVRNQIEIIKKVFKDSNFYTNVPGESLPFIDNFPELVKKQSSVLTGWTYSNLTDFGAFPGNDMGPADTMNFGRCKDLWQDNGGQPKYDIPSDLDPKFPPTPGNCVTGGRTGYSVKLVSPSTLLQGVLQQLGGPKSQPGLILNPIPMEYLNNF